AHVDRRRGALEHVEVLRRRRQVGHALHGRRAGPDDADDLVVQPVEVPAAVTPGIAVVPPAGMERVATERLDPRDPGQRRAVQRPVGHHHEARAQTIAAVGRDQPPAGVLVPTQCRDFGLQACTLVEPEVQRNVPAVREDLGRVRVLLLRDVAELLEERQVDVRLDVACRSRIAVPVPRSTDVAALLDQQEVVDPGLAQPGAHEQPAEPAADDGDPDRVRTRLTLDGGRVRVVEVAGEGARHLDVLVVAVGAQALVALGTIFLAQRDRIERVLGHVDHCGRAVSLSPRGAAGSMATTSTPARMSAPPASSRGVTGSPRKSQAKATANTGMIASTIERTARSRHAWLRAYTTYTPTVHASARTTSIPVAVTPPGLCHAAARRSNGDVVRSAAPKIGARRRNELAATGAFRCATA